MAESKTSICNLALNEIGNSRISDIDDNNENARVCRLLYSQTLDELLTWPLARWKFAMARGQLSEDANTPDFGWDYQFPLPSNCKKLLEIVTDDGDVKNIPYELEGKMVLINDDECYVRYIIDKEDAEGDFPPWFINALVKLLASRLAQRLAKNPQLARTIYEEFLKVVLPQALGADAEQGYVDNEDGSYTWATAGR